MWHLIYLQWMDGTLMMRWINEIYLKYTGSKKSLLVMDTFSAHCSDEIISLLSKHHSRFALIPGGCTSKLQPLDVSLNKPFKQVCRQEFHTSCCYQLATMSSSADRLKTASKARDLPVGGKIPISSPRNDHKVIQSHWNFLSSG